MRKATPHGLANAFDADDAEGSSRSTCVCIHGAKDAAEEYKQALSKKWLYTSAEEAAVELAKPDVTVTNQSDKNVQIHKLLMLQSTVKEAFCSSDNGHGVAFSSCRSLCKENEVGPRIVNRNKKNTRVTS